MTLPDFEGSIGFQIRAVPPLDVGGDGDLDLVLLFRKRGTGLLCGDVEASLTGDTFTGRSFVGSDSVTVIGWRYNPKLWIGSVKKAAYPFA